MRQAIVFYDGYCYLCNGFVEWLIKRDKDDIFRFASLESEHARKLNLLPHSPTVVFYDGEKQYSTSDAFVEIMKRIQYPWKAFQYVKHLPKGLRNGIYKLIATNRYRWFGKSESCQIPDRSIAHKFL